MRKHLTKYIHLEFILNHTTHTHTLSWSVWAAMTVHHRLGGLHNKHLFLTLLEAGKSKVNQGTSRLVGGENLGPGSCPVSSRGGPSLEPLL